MAFILKIVLIIGSLSLIGLSLSKADPEKTLVTIGDGGISGLYYPTAGNIAQAVIQKRTEYGIRILVKPKPSAVSILEANRGAF